jgi:NDP-sugar pyrophosphorylase family protein
MNWPGTSTARVTALYERRKKVRIPAMSPRNRLEHTMGIVLVGTHPWTKTAFDRLPPRPLLPVAHRPLLSYSLSWLRDGGVRDAAVCANRETHVLESRLHRHIPAGLRVSYHVDAMPRGAAGAVRDAADASRASTFVVTDGTSIPATDLTDLLSFHDDSGAAVTVVSHLESSRHGRTPIQVPSGIYVFSRKVVEHIPDRGFCDIKENLLPQLHRANLPVNVFTVDHPSPRVLDASSYRAVNEWMVDHLIATRTIPEGYLLSGSCLCHRDSVIARDATFVGPVLVGPGAQVSSGAVIVGPTSIGRDVKVGREALVSRSAIWRRSVIREHVVADRCVLADGSLVLPRTRLFGQVISASRCGTDVVPTSSDPVRDRASTDLFRKLSRAVFGNVAWSRYPAAQ